MGTSAEQHGFSRRDFIKTTGALIVAFNVPSLLRGVQAAEPLKDAKIPADQLDSWLNIGADGAVQAFVGKVETGMGITTCFMQFVAEELDVPVERVKIVMSDTAITPDQGGTGSSNGIATGGKALREAAAEARAFLLAQAATRLDVPVEELVVKDGVVSARAAPDKRVSYGELIGGQRFDIKVSGNAKPKDPHSYTIVGKSVPREDIPPKVTGAYAFVVDVRLPNMAHGRVVRPPVMGAKLLTVSGPRNVPGVLNVVRKHNFLGVVAEQEWQAIRAAQALKATWSEPAAAFPNSYDELYAAMRTMPIKSTRERVNVGDVDAALKSAARKFEAEYEHPFQSHACMGPACAVADVTRGGATVWFAGQKSNRLQQAIADLLGVPTERVRVIWSPGPGSYGTNDADDAAADAALLSQAAGRPVRVQWMRADGTAWDPKGPPYVIRMRGGLDAKGNVVAWSFESRCFSGSLRAAGALKAGDTLAGQLLGIAPPGADEFGIAAEEYTFPNKRKIGHVLPWTQSLGTGLRTAHLRDPNGPQTVFASESFMDELAVAAGADSVEFRLRHLQDPRHIAVIRAAAERAGWVPRPSPNKDIGGPVVTGRGIAYTLRNGAFLATVADVEVKRDSGEARVTRFVVAHDCGFIVNPDGLKGTIEANVIQSMSRALYEEVQFDSKAVKSVDWKTYPMIEMAQVPDEIEMVLLNNTPDQPSKGAGEPATRPTTAAIANAIFDATGVRLRRVPFTRERIKAAWHARSA